ncbi:MAG: DUF1553 domain-containing protein, partial [Planctomycetes bacterium]|nr:DUF1553 domain-containing protein [Planctomycetota bacterium]
RTRRMPPESEGSALRDSEIATLKAWIDQGARAPAEPIPPDPRRHWAFQEPVRQAVPPSVPCFRGPEVSGSDTLPRRGRESMPPSRWGRNPVDAFLAVAHSRQGLSPSPPVSDDLLLRRVYLDLIGLPPTREELHAFRNDRSPGAYERVVERLLDDPRHGERWGRHWMDVWRYSDWYGLEGELRASHKHIWRWRDWIIESLNRDKGYDRMVLEMLAGDELAPTDPDILRATGYLVRNWYIFNRNFWLDDVIQHTARGFLGLTMQCARCHDHKYDPISQVDYYRFRAFFEPHHVRIDRIPAFADREQNGLSRVYDATPDMPTYLFVRGDENHPDRSRPLRPGTPDVLEGRVEITPISLPRDAYCPDKRDFVLRETLAGSAAEVARARDGAAAVTRLRWELQRAEVRHAALTAVIRAEQLEDAGKKGSAEWTKWAVEAAGRQRELAVLEAGVKRWGARQTAAAAPATERDEASKKVADAEQALARAEAERRKPTTTAYTPRPLAFPRAKTTYREVVPNDPYPKVSTGRRLALARWVADRNNPLTARVAVNHVWTRHFGAPLVGSMFDFGLRTPRPVHHELLDWLSVEFMESGWSMKHLHRLLVTSEAYRMRSWSEGRTQPNQQRDPDNRFLWRMNPRRLEGEVLRDSLLHLAGRLDSRQGGPELPIADAEGGTRRTVYYHYAKDERIPFLTMFDAPSVEECYRRHETIVPQQALVMSNSKLTLARASEIAAAISREVGGHDTPAVRAAFIVSAFERILGRVPTVQERGECEAALAELTLLFTADRSAGAPARDRARASLVHVLLNHNDFVTAR